ncbi:MAG: hypothetical protein ACPGYT_05505 [Nitrospirales bacterium]
MRSRKMIISGVLVIIFMAISTTGVTSASTLPSDNPMNDWVKLSANGNFSLKAPPGSHVTKQSGIDSSVVTFVTPKAELLSDYGLYSNSLKDGSGLTDYMAVPIMIDGQEASVVTWDTGDSAAPQRYFIGVHFPQLKQSFLGYVKLTIETFVADKHDYELVKTILNTIRFSK